MLEILFSDCVVESYELFEQAIVLRARSRKVEACCPLCKELSNKVQGYYKRCPNDLPLANYRIQFCLKVKRFYCLNSSCDRTTFAESFEPWLARYAHRSNRLKVRQGGIAIAMSAKAGEALLSKMQITISHDTLLNFVRRQVIPSSAAPRVLGVDDFALRKGKSYGTLLLDMEKHKVIDLLLGREAKTVSDWLKQYPSIEIISRDRAQEYKKACDEAAPQAIQVADRWHLLKNLSDHLTQWFESHRNYLVTESSSQNAKSSYEQVLINTANRAKNNLRLYKKAKKLKEQGWHHRAIAKKLGMTKSTVFRWLKDGLPGNKWPSLLDPYLSYLKERWDAGCRKPQELYLEIRTQGFQGQKKLVECHLASLNAGLADTQERLTSKNRLRTYSPNEACRLFTRSKESLSKSSCSQRDSLFSSLKTAQPCYDLVQRFISLFQMKDQENEIIIQAFHSFIEAAKHSDITELARFAKSLEHDKAAVEAALTLPWSNGMTEGKITKLKFIKRQMYGRASFNLLKQKVLLAA